MHSNDFRCAKFCQWRPSRWFCGIGGVGVMCIPRRSQSMQWAFAPKDKLVATCRNTLCIFSATSSISALNRCWHIAFILCKLHFAQRKCVHANFPTIPLGMGEWESSGGVFERFPIRFVIWFFFLKIGLFFWFFSSRKEHRRKIWNEQVISVLFAPFWITGFVSLNKLWLFGMTCYFSLYFVVAFVTSHDTRWMALLRTKFPVVMRCLERSSDSNLATPDVCSKFLESCFLKKSTILPGGFHGWGLFEKHIRVPQLLKTSQSPVFKPTQLEIIK